MGWIGCVHCEKLENDFLAQTCALNAPVQPVLPRVSCSNETLPNAPKHYEAISWHELVHYTPVQPIFNRVSCSNKILPNTHKHYETHTNMSFGSNGVDWLRSLRKVLMRLHGTNFCINCTSSTRFASSFV